jgi:hypothetical protein
VLRRVELAPGSVAVCILTGHGLKDTDAVPDVGTPVVAPTVEAILEVLA